MNYFAVNMILMLIIINFIGVCNSSPNVELKNLEIKIKELVDKQQIIQDDDQILEPEKYGFIGYGSSAIVWRSTLTETKVDTSDESGSTSPTTDESAAEGTDNSSVDTNKITINEKQIATKFGTNVLQFQKELFHYKMFGAINNASIEAYGIPAIYFTGLLWENIPVFGCTLCERPLFEYSRYRGLRGELNILCAFYQAMFSIKFIHGHGIIHNDIKRGNLLVRGRRLFLIDFNVSARMANKKRVSGGNRRMGSIAYMLHLNRFWMDDLKSLFYNLLLLAGGKLPWYALEDKIEIAKSKLNDDEVRNACMAIETRYPIVHRVLLYFYDLVMLPTNPDDIDTVQVDPRIPPYNDIGEEILKGINDIIGCRDVLFKWKKDELSTDESKATSNWIIETYNNLPGGHHSQLCDEERENLERLGLLSTAE